MVALFSAAWKPKLYCGKPCPLVNAVRHRGDNENDRSHESLLGRTRSPLVSISAKSVRTCSENYFFKIHYYDTDIRFLADDPSDPAHTRRVITIMRASEWQ
jgi:hypothetical protein